MNWVPWRIGLVAAASCAAVAAGCQPQRTAAAQLQVVASFYPLEEFARRIGGPRTAVRNLVPAGVEPHDYEPAPQDIAALQRADLIVYNGAGFEPWWGRLSAQIGPHTVTVNATAGIVLAQGIAANDAERSGTQASGRPDPHVWLDPVLAQHQVANIMAGLLQADLAGKPVYEPNAARLTTELQTLHQAFAETLRRCRGREFLTTHAAFGYLARRYGLRQIAISGLSPEAEPSPQRLKALVQLARRHGLKMIFYETLVNPRVAQTLAQEVGAQVAVLNPVEGLTPVELHEGQNYFTVMHANLNALAAGLDCR